MRRFTPPAASPAIDICGRNVGREGRIGAWRPYPAWLAFALAGGGVFGGPVHQRGIVAAEQDLAEADRRLGLHLAVGARLAVAAAQRLHQAFGRLLDIMLQVGIGPQRDLVDGEFAGIVPAGRDEIDQRGDLLDLAASILARKRYPCRRAGAGCGGRGRARSRFPIAASWRCRRGSPSSDGPMWNSLRMSSSVRSPRTPSCSVFQLLADIVELAAPDIGAQAGGEQRQVVRARS